MKAVCWKYLPTGEEASFHGITMTDEQADKYVERENNLQSNYDFFYWAVTIKNSINWILNLQRKN